MRGGGISPVVMRHSAAVFFEWMVVELLSALCIVVAVVVVGESGSARAMAVPFPVVDAIQATVLNEQQQTTRGQGGAGDRDEDSPHSMEECCWDIGRSQRGSRTFRILGWLEWGWKGGVATARYCAKSEVTKAILCAPLKVLHSPRTP